MIIDDLQGQRSGDLVSPHRQGVSSITMSLDTIANYFRRSVEICDSVTTECLSTPYTVLCQQRMAQGSRAESSRAAFVAPNDRQLSSAQEEGLGPNSYKHLYSHGDRLTTSSTSGFNDFGVLDGQRQVAPPGGRRKLPRVETERPHPGSLSEEELPGLPKRGEAVSKRTSVVYGDKGGSMSPDAGKKAPKSPPSQDDRIQNEARFDIAAPISRDLVY